MAGLPKDCSEQDIRDYLKKHRDDDPEPIEVQVWYEEHYEYSIAHVIYEGEEYSVPASLAYELSGAVFDGMTLMTGVICSIPSPKARGQVHTLRPLPYS